MFNHRAPMKHQKYLWFFNVSRGLHSLNMDFTKKEKETESQVQIHQLRVQIYELRVHNHELGDLEHELQDQKHELGD